MERTKKNLALLKNKQFLIAFISAWVLFFLSIVISIYANTYATESASNPVTDIILSNIRTFDVDGIFVYGPFVFIAFVLYLGIRDTHQLPFMLKATSLFVVIRSIFVSLTHLGPFPTQNAISAHNIFSSFSVGSDLFFSAHTGFPFLMALIFWDVRPLRYLCIAVSIFFGCIVLMGHYHYSIDVLSAFFITYGIYHIAERIFKKDKQYFDAKTSIA